MNERRAAILGAGTIGSGWATVFANGGWHVTLYDAVAGQAEAAAARLVHAPASSAAGAAESSPASRVRVAASLADAVRDADFVQECAPDVLTVKRELLAHVERSAPRDCVVASSTSAFRPSDLQAELETAERVLVGHPFHPVALIPLVEVVGGERTASARLDDAVAVYESLGKTVIRVQREVVGHVVNRLQAALFREAVHLVTSGVASSADVDRGIAYGPALRWPLTGAFLTWHLAAGAGGIGEYLRRLGPSLELMWSDLGSPALDEATRSRLVRELERECGGRSVEELTPERDRRLATIAAALAATGRLV